MRIVHAITRLVHGGAQINTILTVAHQLRQGHEVWLASGPQTGAEGSLWELARQRGLEPHLLPDLVREVDLPRDLRAFAELLALLRAVKPHVVHTHTSKAGVLGRWAAWLTGVPIIIHTPHGHVFHGYFSRSASRLFTAAERLSARITHRMVALTATERDEHLAARVGRPERFAVIPSGVELDVLPTNGQSRAELGLPMDGPLVGCVARLAEVKGPQDLIRAMPLILRSHPGAHLVVVGDGPLRHEMEAEIVRLGLTGKVTLPGRLDHPGPVLALLDLLVVPSRNEGMGRAAVEGMAAGLPLVATRVGGLLDVVQDGETGLLVPPSNPEALAAAVTSLLAQPEKAHEMGRAARRRAERFSASVMLRDLDALYDELAAERIRP